MAPNALRYVRARVSDIHKRCLILESLASSALAGSRTAEICLETLRRVTVGDPISDRYILGLAWFLKELEEQEKKDAL